MIVHFHVQKNWIHDFLYDLETVLIQRILMGFEAIQEKIFLTSWREHFYSIGLSLYIQVHKTDFNIVKLFSF